MLVQDLHGLQDHESQTRLRPLDLHLFQELSKISDHAVNINKKLGMGPWLFSKNANPKIKDLQNHPKEPWRAQPWWQNQHGIRGHNKLFLKGNSLLAILVLFSDIPIESDLPTYANYIKITKSLFKNICITSSMYLLPYSYLLRDSSTFRVLKCDQHISTTLWLRVFGSVWSGFSTSSFADVFPVYIMPYPNADIRFIFIG